MVILVTVLGGFDRLGRLCWLQIMLQTAECLLGSGQVTGLQIAGQVLVIGIRLGVFAEGLGGGGLGSALQRLLKRGHGTFGRVQVAGLEGAANGLEILGNRVRPALVRALIMVRDGRHAGNTAHKFCDSIVV